jgi:hypothetical protein
MEEPMSEKPPPLALLAGLAWQDREQPRVVLHWILRKVPCFQGKIPVEWTDAVFAKLKEQGVSPATIGQALRAARASGYNFTPTLESIGAGYGQFASPPVGAPTGASVPKVVEDRLLAGERVKSLQARVENAQKAGDWGLVARLGAELAWLKYDLQMSADGGGTPPGGGGTPPNGGATAPTGGGTANGNPGGGAAPNDDPPGRPRPDGLQNERPGGAPLEPPHQRRPPVRVPLPTPGPGTPVMPGTPTRAPGGGPFRTPGR